MYQTFYGSSEYLSFPLVGLGIFLTFFLGTVLWAYWPRGAQRFQDRAELPLAEDLDGQR